MARSTLLVLALVAVTFAGCSAKPDPAPSSPTVSFDDLALAAAADKGVARGVVVDQAIRPLAGAAVVVVDSNATVTTDTQGRFGFSDLAPGLHFLTAAKPGYGKVQTSIDVVAGVADPAPVTIQLARLPGTEPYVSQLVWDGFMECSWTAGGAFATGCLIGDYTDDNSRQFSSVDGVPRFLQAELLWEPTQTLGTSLCMRHYASEDIGGEVLVDDVCGGNPLLHQVDAARLNETKVGAGKGIESVVWVDGYGDHLGPGLALNQRFTVYTHLFYNFDPDPAWRFATDGPYPVPH